MYIRLDTHTHQFNEVLTFPGRYGILGREIMYTGVRHVIIAVWKQSKNNSGYGWHGYMYVCIYRCEQGSVFSVHMNVHTLRTYVCTYVSTYSVHHHDWIVQGEER